jgi:DNA-binding NarL/FixJ family response regulator
MVSMWSKVLIVADQPIVRFGLARLLSQETDIEVCGEAETGADALAKTEKLRPHLAVIGIPLENKVQPSLFSQLRTIHPPLKILVGVRVDDPVLACHFVRQGVNGCIHWREPLADVLKAVRAVLRGDLYLGNLAAKRLLQYAVDGKSPGSDGIESLSDREVQIFAMIGQGQTTRHIASTLDLKRANGREPPQED